MEQKAPAHILVVDDDRLVLASIGRGLRDAGYRVSVAGNGDDALEIAARDRPDLALLDVRMPGIGGLELYRQLVAKDGDLGRRFIFITGDTGSLGSSNVDTADASVLAKPFTAADLDAVLNRIVPRETP